MYENILKLTCNCSTWGLHVGYHEMQLLEIYDDIQEAGRDANTDYMHEKRMSYILTRYYTFNVTLYVCYTIGYSRGSL